MIKRYILILLLVLAFVKSYSQNESLQTDTVLHKLLIDDVLSSKPFQMTYFAVPLFVTGSMYDYHHLEYRDFKRNFFKDFSTNIDDYLQFSPIAITYALKVCGVESKSSWKELILSSAFAYAIAFGSAKTLKANIYYKRPDATGNNSFPSGHTTFAFMNAHILAKEYGEKSWLFALAAYSLSSTTGIMRVMNERHWLGDVVAGAGLGVLSTEVAYLLKDAIMGNKSQTFVPTVEESREEKPSFVAINTTFNHSLNNYKLNNNRELNINDGAAVGFESAYFYHKFFGVGISADHSSYKSAKINMWQDSTLSFYYSGINHYFSYPIYHRMFLGAKIGAGISRNIENTLLDGIIESQYRLRYNLGASLSFWVKRNTFLRFFADYTHSQLKIEDKDNHFRTINLGAAAAFHF